ncbi:hypothetical protein EEL31_08780 [Brevibacillus laterosporus]|nr:hypothetical protein [Brevibacillus laterosporus]TPG68604.1 hypothetical protein EEL31_08780 [Brevibacillus laterosporus]
MTEQQTIETLATKVMGWGVITNDWRGLMFRTSDGTYVSEWKWNPSRDLNHAFQVVDKLLSHFYVFELMGSEDGWIATFKFVDGNFIYPKEWEGTGETREQAICNAAMKVVALKKEDSNVKF